MKRFRHFGSAVLFCIILVLLVGGFSWVFLPKDNTREAGVEDFISNAFLGEPEQSLDVLVLGDSVPKFGMIPAVLWHEQGYTSYVCATAGKSFPKALELMEQFMERQSPKVVLLETHLFFRPVDPNYDAQLKLERIFPLLRYHSNWKDVSPKQMLRPVDYTCTTPEKGYYLCKLIEPADASHYMAPSDETMQLDPSTFPYVRKMMELCREKGSQLVLFSIPSTENMDMPRSRALTVFAEENGLPYLDMDLHAGEIGIDWSIDTADKGDHLNFWGAQKATKYLGAYLEDLKLLADHRQDPAFEQWNKDRDTFMAQAYAAYGNTDYNPIEE